MKWVELDSMAVAERTPTLRLPAMIYGPIWGISFTFLAGNHWGIEFGRARLESDLTNGD